MNTRPMRDAFILAFAANVALTLVSLAVLPDRVAVHFGADGTANGWMSNGANAAFMSGLHLLLFVSLYFSPRLMFLFPPRWLNLPHKQYWLQPEHRPEALAKVRVYMWQFGAVIFVFLFVVGLLSVQANMTEPARLNLSVFFPALIAFLLYSLGWTVLFLLAFRLPIEQRVRKGVKLPASHRR